MSADSTVVFILQIACSLMVFAAAAFAVLASVVNNQSDVLVFVGGPVFALISFAMFHWFGMPQSGVALAWVAACMSFVPAVLAGILAIVAVFNETVGAFVAAHGGAAILVWKAIWVAVLVAGARERLRWRESAGLNKNLRSN